jgi:hypothetical protein
MLASMLPHPPQDIGTNAYIGADDGSDERAPARAMFADNLVQPCSLIDRELFE